MQAPLHLISESSLPTQTPVISLLSKGLYIEQFQVVGYATSGDQSVTERSINSTSLTLACVAQGDAFQVRYDGYPIIDILLFILRLCVEEG
jgi:hypothetical protein